MHASKKRALSLALGLAVSAMSAATAVSALPLPMVFEANQGQTDPQVRFTARSGGSALFLMEDGGTVLSLGQGADGERQTVRMSLVGGSPRPRSSGEGEHGVVSYYRGKDPAQWHAGIPTWDRARYAEVYPGIDLVYYASGNRLEHDFVVAPGADPGSILLRFDGLDQKDRPVALDAEGRLRLSTMAGEVVFEAPVVYQEVDGAQRKVAGRYEPAGPGRVRFAVGEYDAKRPLVIDPVLVYSSFLGGSSVDDIQEVAVDGAGNTLLTGLTQSDDFPLVSPAVSSRPGGYDLYVAKVSADGSHLVYSTFLGSSQNDQPTGIAADAAGNAYVSGWAVGSDYPLLNPVQPGFGGVIDVFVTELSPAGSLVYSTYLGGSNFDEPSIGAWGSNVAVMPDGTAYISGATYSADFPQVQAIQPGLQPGSCGDPGDSYPCGDLFLTVIAPGGGQIIYSTLWGAPDADDGAAAVAVDSAGTAYLLGETSSPDFPLVNPFQAQVAGGTDLFLMKLRPDGTPPVYATLLGGGGTDGAWGVAVDPEGYAYVLAQTSSVDLPVRHGIQTAYAGGGLDWYLARINPRGTGIDYGTYLGGDGIDAAWGFAIDALGNTAVVGYSLGNPSFPLLRPMQALHLPDALVAKIHATGPVLLYSTPLGGATGEDHGFGIAMDARGDVHAGGSTSALDFPLHNPFQPAHGAQTIDPLDAFVARIADGLATLATPSRVPAQPGGSVTVPVRFTPGGFDIAFTALSVDYDEACLTFDPADANADGIPDAITFNLPPGFAKSVRFDAGDTDGEIDISIFDPSPPFALLPLGEPARITFGVKPTCGSGAVLTTVRVGFSSAPQVSFGDITGHSVPGISLDGSVEVWGGLRGDCNGDQIVDAGDLGASVLEVFDTDGAYWLDAPFSTFPGSPAGCDANADTVIDAGDLSCSILIIFHGPGACSPGLLRAAQPPALDLDLLRVAVGRGAGVVVPVRLTRGSADVNSVIFSLHLPAGLTFDPTDADGDGVPDAVAFRLPRGFVGSVQWTPWNSAGQLAVVITDPTGQRKPLPDGVLASVSLKWAGQPSPSPQIRFGTAPAASFGDIDGRSAPGLTRD